MKGAKKVSAQDECKKWSAKGTYRKASADREPTQDVNTLGGPRPRADSKRKRAFRRALGLFYRRVASFRRFLVRRFVVLPFLRFVVRCFVLVPFVSMRRSLVRRFGDLSFRHFVVRCSS